jgi:Predicted dehydrogenases and related proteins
MKQLAVAVIGIGRMGSVHAANIKKGRVKNAGLCAVCDISSEAVSKFIKKHGEVKTYADYKIMLEAERIDAVIIATEHYHHADIAVYCMEHGVAVLVEKPLAVTAKEARRVAECAKRTGVVAAVMLNQRTNPLYATAKKLVDGGEIGKIQRVNFIVTDWYRSQAYYNQGGWRASLWGEGGGTLINQCVHQLDLLEWIVGIPESVLSYSFTKNRNITTENDVTALMRYKGDVFCSFSASTHELSGTNRLEIAGDKGRIVIDKYKMKVTTYAKSEPEVNDETKFGYGYVGISHIRKKSYKMGFILTALRGGQQLNIVKNFLAAVDGHGSLISPIVDGVDSVDLINALYLSSWEDREVALPADENYYAEVLKNKIEEEKLLLGGKND